MAARLPGIIEKVEAAALRGSPKHQRIFFDFCVPRLKPVDEPLKITLHGKTLADKADEVVAAVAAGKITPDQGAALMDLLRGQAQIVQVSELEERLTAIEDLQTRLAGQDNGGGRGGQ